MLDLVWLLGPTVFYTLPEIPELGRDNRMAAQLSPIAAYFELVGRGEWFGLAAMAVLAVVITVLAMAVPTRRDHREPRYDLVMHSSAGNEGRP